MGKTYETRRTDINSPHACEALSNTKTRLHVWYDYVDDKWILMDLMYGVHEPIIHCPWCGIKLPT